MENTLSLVILVQSLLCIWLTIITWDVWTNQSAIYQIQCSEIEDLKKEIKK